ncbi:MAG: STAS domain-containing protein [Acidimicrobiales bacterium]|nr:STAS domain-containing protein [Acidimicrobiales bacterium]
MSTQPSRLTISSNENRHLTVRGVIDSHTSTELMSRLEELGTGDDLTIDLRAVEFIDSSGLRILVATHQKLDDASHTLHLSGLSEPVERIFEITGLRDHLNVSD